MPNIILNPLALALASLLGFFLSYAWYGPLWGKIWQREMKLTAADAPQGGALAKALIMTLLSVFLIAFVLANNIGAWMPSSWGFTTATSKPAQFLQAAGFTWLGYFLPQLLFRHAWERRSWTLFFIDAGYALSLLLLLSATLVFGSH
jgi:hypothetical protein